MKKIRKNIILLFALGLVLIINSCEKKEDYSDIIFKNYLTYEINRATNFLSTTVEGTKEGQYNTGSKQVYQSVIDDAKEVAESESSTQEDVDNAYEDLLQAAEDFFDQMVPFKSVFQELIDYANIVQENTDEGEQEGNVKTGNKAVLQDAIDAANQTFSRQDLTQRMLDQEMTTLTAAIYSFNGEIIGSATTAVVNPGFELPGYETTDYNEVNGWNVFGKAEDWAPLASIAADTNTTDGQYVAKIGSYTQGIYQNVAEMIHPNAEYKLSFNVSLLSNKSDWQGKKYPAIILSRLIVFGSDIGDYDFVSVVSESYDTLGITPGGYVELSQTVNIDGVSAFIGEKVAIDFVQRHTWDPEDQIWAESFVAIDNVRLYRKL